MTSEQEVLSTREIVKRMLENALANDDAPDYRRALIDVLMYDDQHKALREEFGVNSAYLTVTEAGKYEVSGDSSSGRLHVRKVDPYPGPESDGCCGGGCSGS